MHPGRQFEWKQVLDSELESKSTWFQPPPGWILEIQIVSAILILVGIGNGGIENLISLAFHAYEEHPNRGSNASYASI
jgi:hypothetical protein